MMYSYIEFDKLEVVYYGKYHEDDVFLYRYRQVKSRIYIRNTIENLITNHPLQRGLDSDRLAGK